MALGFFLGIKDGFAKIQNEKGEVIDIDPARIPEGLRPGSDFNYRQSKRGHINIRPPAEPKKLRATNSAKARQAYAIRRLMSPGHGPDGKGWSLAQASGIVGRFMVESFNHLDTNARNPKDPGTSEGIGQWNRERKSAMRNFTSKYENKLDGQIDFFDHEIMNDPRERLARAALIQARTPEQSSIAMMHYERPGGYKPSRPTRGLGFQQTLANANSLMKGFDPDFVPEQSAVDDSLGDVAPEGAGYDPGSDPGNMTADAGEMIDAGQDEEQTLGDSIMSASTDYASGGDIVDTSGSLAFAQEMQAEGAQAAAQGGYLPRLPTINEIFGNG